MNILSHTCLSKGYIKSDYTDVFNIHKMLYNWLVKYVACYTGIMLYSVRCNISYITNFIKKLFVRQHVIEKKSSPLQHTLHNRLYNKFGYTTHYITKQILYNRFYPLGTQTNCWDVLFNNVVSYIITWYIMQNGQIALFVAYILGLDSLFGSLIKLFSVI